MPDALFALLLAIAATVADPRALRLTLDTHSAAAGVLHVSRVSRIAFDVTLHRPMSPPLGPMIEAERPEPEFENHDPHYFDHRPGPNVEFHVARMDGTRQADVPIRVFSSGSGGTVNTEYAVVDIIVPPPDTEARLTKMMDCLAGMVPQKLTAKDMAGLRGYVQSYIVDNEPGTYQVTASYRATTWSKKVPAVVSPPLVFIIDEGIDGYQQFCDHFARNDRKP